MFYIRLNVLKGVSKRTVQTDDGFAPNHSALMDVPDNFSADITVQTEKDNDWQTVTRKSTQKRTDKATMKTIFWSRLQPNFDSSKASKYIINNRIARKNEFSLTPLYNENRRNKTFISYKIEVVSSKYHDLLNSSRWPVGSSVRKFYKAHKRQSRKQLAENRSGFF